MQQEVALRLQVSELKASVGQQKELVKAARDEMELTKGQLERQRKREKIAAQPRIALEATDFKWHRNLKVFTIELSNKGAWLSNVALKDYPEDLNVEFSIDESGRWGSGMNISFDVTVPEDKSLRHNDKIRVVLECLDGLGEQENFDIFFLMNENNRLVYSRG
jgi:hypothetical protein